MVDINDLPAELIRHIFVQLLALHAPLTLPLVLAPAAAVSQQWFGITFGLYQQHRRKLEGPACDPQLLAHIWRIRVAKAAGVKRSPYYSLHDLWS